MKKTIKTFTAVLFSLMLMAVLTAGDTYDQSISVTETSWDVNVYGTIDFSSDSTGNFYTQAIYIGDCNYYDGTLFGYTNAQSGDSVDVYVEYSTDRSTWKLGTANSGKIVAAANMDNGTVKADTINVYDGTRDVLFNAAVWMRLKFDGLASNPDETDVVFGIHLRKTQEARPMSRTQRIRNRVS